MKKLISLLLAAILTFGAALTCAAQDDNIDHAAVNAEQLQWFKMINREKTCMLFIPQSKALFAMQPDAQFTVYGKEQDTEQLTALKSGSTAQWSRREFTDANGRNYAAWTLSDMPDSICRLQFAQGAFTDKSGDPSPEMSAEFSAYVNTNGVSCRSAALRKLQTVKTDTQLVEGEYISFTHYSAKIPAAFFGVQAKTDHGDLFIAAEYDAYGDLTFPATAGHVQYTLLFFGQPIDQTEAIYALSREDYANLHQKDRSVSILKGIALIPCLPVFLLIGGLGGSAAAAALSVAFTPTLVLLPLTSIPAFAVGLGQGAQMWWQTVCDLIGGND